MDPNGTITEASACNRDRGCGELDTLETEEALTGTFTNVTEGRHLSFIISLRARSPFATLSLSVHIQISFLNSYPFLESNVLSTPIQAIPTAGLYHCLRCVRQRRPIP
jgi:hypothetical protein